MNDTTIAAVSLLGVAGAAVLAQSTSSSPGRLFGGRVGRYESGGKKFASFAGASRHQAGVMAEIAKLDEQIDALQKHRSALQKTTGIRDPKTGMEHRVSGAGRSHRPSWMDDD